MNKVDTIKNYNIYQFDNEYIIHNTNKEFSQGHTHVRNYKTAVYLANLAVHNSMPYHMCRYFAISLSRIADNEEYKNKLLEFLNNKKDKQTYANRGNYNCKKKKY